MEQPASPRALVALYETLAHAEETMNRLEGAGLPYPRMHLSARVQAPKTGFALPEYLWVLTVACAGDAEWLRGQLQQSPLLALGWQTSLPPERADVEWGQNAWGHYVFESPAATDQTGDAAGTSGTTGVINSGAFARQALVEEDPPERE